jgi:hypothetical protein
VHNPLLRRQKAIEFLEGFFRLTNSIPENLRHKNWSNMRTLLLECLEQNNPLDGFYYFSRSMDQVTGSQDRQIQISDQDRMAFEREVPRNISLIFPSEPTMKLNFTPR